MPLNRMCSSVVGGALILGGILAMSACSAQPRDAGASSKDAGASVKKQAGGALPQLAEPAPFLEENSHPTGPEGIKGPGVPDFWVRPGWKVTLVSDNLVNARFMALDANGTLYLSRPQAEGRTGDVIMLRPSADGTYKVSGTFADGLSKPHGLYYKDGWLWITSDGKVQKAKVTDGKKHAGELTTVLSGLPQGGHWWRSILVTDDYFYTSIGDDGNINDDGDKNRERIWRYNLDGSGKHLFVSGIRNTEKLLVRPGTADIFGCDQGSDWYGGPLGDKEHDQPITDFNPPEEFNHYVDGGFYGHPFIVGNRLPRLEYMNRPDIRQLAAQTIPPAYCMGPHWAADGWTFVQGKGDLPASFDRDAVIAFRGSWNRAIKAGYRVEHLIFDKDLNIPIGSEMLVGTLSAGGDTLARPVDVVQAPDGSLLFSDDQRNSIWRLQYVGK